MGLDSKGAAQHVADKPKDEDVEINFKTSSGIRDFASYRLGSYKEGAKFLKRGLEIVQARKLLGATGSLHTRRLSAQCCGSGAEGVIYQVEAHLVAHENGRDLDWAEVKCSCPHAEKAPVCKHVLAMLLARLDPEAWQAAGGEVQADWAAAAEAGRNPGAAARSSALDKVATSVRDTAAAAVGSSALDKVATSIRGTAAAAAGSAAPDRAATPIRATAAAAARLAAPERAATPVRETAAAAAGSAAPDRAATSVRETAAAAVPAPARPVAPQAQARGTQGIARKRRLPNLTSPSPSPAAKRAAPSKAPKQHVNTGKARAGVHSVLAAGGAARRAPLVMWKRKEGKQLLEEDDDELVRQCHQALAGAAIRSGGVQQDLQQQSMQQPAGNVASQQQSVQQPAGNVNTQQAVAAAPDVQPQQLAVPSAADGVPAAVHPEAAVPGSPGPQEPAPAAAAVPPGGPSMFDELFGAGGAFS